MHAAQTCGTILRRVDGSFNLSMFPDKYKQEFAKNADWLRFSFHSLANKPDRPYKNATYEQVMREGRIVEQGNREGLLEKSGFYAELYRSQFEGALAG